MTREIPSSSCLGGPLFCLFPLSSFYLLFRAMASIGSPATDAGANPKMQPLMEVRGEQKFIANSHSTTSPSVFRRLLVVRAINAYWLLTFFQPDEYFQALEPAWQMAFGDASGAWITWVCIYMCVLVYLSGWLAGWLW